MTPTVLVGIVLTLVVLIALVVWRARRERARKAEISQWAVSRGWTVTPRPGVIEWTSRLPGTNRGGVSLILSSTVYGWPVRVAEYSYTTSSEDSTTTHHYVVTAVRLAAWYERSRSSRAAGYPGWARRSSVTTRPRPATRTSTGSSG